LNKFTQMITLKYYNNNYYHNNKINNNNNNNYYYNKHRIPLKTNLQNNMKMLELEKLQLFNNKLLMHHQRENKLKHNRVYKNLRKTM
jgi:hypothetical protein